MPYKDLEKYVAKLGLYNLLSYAIGFWEPVIPPSELPNKIAYVDNNTVGLSNGKPRSDLIIRNISGSNIINVTEI